MSNGNAIVARFGVDYTAVNTGMQAASLKVNESMKSMKKAAEEVAGAHEKLFASEHKIEHQLSGLIENFASGASGAQMLAQSLEAVGKSLHLGFTGGALLGIGAVLFEKFSEADAEGKKLTETLRGVQSAARMGSQFSSVGDLEGQLKGLEEINARTRKMATESTWSQSIEAIPAGLFDLVRGRNPGDRIKQQASEGNEALKAEEALKDKIAEKEERLASIARERFEGSERNAEAARINSEFEEKEGAAVRAHNVGVLASLKEEQSIALATNEAKFAASKRQQDLESNLLTIRRNGRDVELETAKAKVAEAEATSAAARSDSERYAAANKLRAAQQDFLDAARAKTIRDQENKDAKDIAGFIGTADEKRTLELQRQRAELEQQRKLAKPDEAAKLDAQITAAAAAQMEERRKLFYEGFNAVDANIDAQGGTTEEARRRTLREHLANAKDRAESLKTDPLATDLDRSQQAAHIKGLENSLAEMNRQREKGIQDATLDSQLLEAKIAGYSRLAEQLQIEKEYRDRINEAQRNGNTEVAKQLELQRQLAIQEKNISEYEKGAKGRAHEREEERRHQHAMHVVGAQERDREQRRLRGAHDEHRLGDHLNGLDRPAPAITVADLKAAFDGPAIAAALSKIGDNLGVTLP